MKKLRFLAVVAAVKVMIISVWLFGGADLLRTALAYAEAPAGKAAAEGHKADDRKGGSGFDVVEAKSPEPVEKGLLASIKRRQKELDAREEALKAKEERLLQIKYDVEARIVEINRIHSEIEAYVKKVDEINGERIKKMVRIYDAMKPEESAVRIAELDDHTASMILSSLSDKKTAKILSLMEVKRSLKLSQALKVK